MRVEAENGATMGKTELAKKAKALNLDAFMIQCMKWHVMKHVMEKRLLDY